MLSSITLCFVLLLLVIGGSSSFILSPINLHQIPSVVSARRTTQTSRHTLFTMSSSAAETNENDISSVTRPFRIRTITVFVTIQPNDFKEVYTNGVFTTGLEAKVDKCNSILRKLETNLVNIGYEVQTVRVATNSFSQWLTQDAVAVDDNDNPSQKKQKTDTESKSIVNERLQQLDNMLEKKDIQFCCVGPSTNPNDTLQICPTIIAASGKFSCNANINAGDINSARAAAQCMQKISTLGDGVDKIHVKGGLGNFRFCAASCIETVPFFPGARAPSHTSHPYSFAIGLENGGFACDLFREAKTISNIKEVFDTKMREELIPIQDVCMTFVDSTEGNSVGYLGIDTSINPSLDEGGSVARAIEYLEEVRGNFGGAGSMAAAAAITTSLQSIPGIATTGYSGLMLPVLEDQRLAELGSENLTIQQLLCISSVCGVGIDTVPLPGDVSEDSLSSLILDVAALAGRWNKPLSCRVFPVPGGKAGEKTDFDSPFMCNSSIFQL